MGFEGAGGVEIGYGGGDPEANALGLIASSLESTMDSASIKMASTLFPLSPMTAVYGYQYGKANMELSHLYGEEYNPMSSDPNVSGVVSLVPAPARVDTISSPDVVAEPSPVMSGAVSTVAAAPERSVAELAEKVKSIVSVPRAAAKRQTIRTGSLGLSGAPVTEKKSLLGQGGKY